MKLSFRAEEFARGHWRALIEAGLRDSPAQSRARPERSDTEERERRGKAVQARVQRGQVSRARQELTGVPLVPKNEATLQELRARPQEQVQPIPQEVLDHVPIAEVNLNAKLFATCEGSAIRFVSRTRRVHQRDAGSVSGQHRNIVHLDFRCGRFCQVFHPFFRAFTMATMTALQKLDGGIRGSQQYSKTGGDIGQAVHV